MRHTYDIGALVVQAASTDLPLTREETKLWLKIEPEEVDEDTLIDSLIARAWARYEAFTGRGALKQTYDWYLDCVPSDALRPPRWPLVSISSIRMFSSTEASDTGGTTMAAANYYVDIASEPGRVQPVSGATWSTSTRTINACIVRFIAGCSTSSTGVPESLKTQLKEMIAAGYEHRGDEDNVVTMAMDVVLQSDELDLPEWG